MVCVIWEWPRISCTTFGFSPCSSMRSGEGTAFVQYRRYLERLGVYMSERVASLTYFGDVLARILGSRESNQSKLARGTQSQREEHSAEQRIGVDERGALLSGVVPSDAG